jgi:CheY-like chemotaxis protein
MLARIIGEDVTLDLELDPELCGTLADRGQLEQVIVNLAVNARDAMPPGGGSMTIRTENVSHDGTHSAEHPEFKAGDYVRLSIADTGVGMEPGTLEHIFEPFFTTRGAAGGTGLGLATVYGIVRASGGDIAVTSELGHGSCFMIYLPAVDAVAQAAPLPEQARPVVPGRETILVVEDEKAVLDLAVKLLRRQGYTVLRASSGKEAVELARSHPGRIDLLFSDLVMPGLSGQETGKAIRAIRPGIRELFSSGYSEDMNASRGLEPGFRFVAKPYTSETLSRSVRDALNSPE